MAAFERVTEWTPSLPRSIERVGLALVHSNAVVASGATAVALTTSMVVQFPLDPLPFVFVFVAAAATYTANRFTDRAEDRKNLPGRSRFIDRYGTSILVLGSIAYVALLVVTARWYLRMLPIALLPVALIAVYATGIATSHFVVKNGLVGFVWGAIPIGLGLYYGRGSEIAVLAVGAIVFLEIAIAAAVFDIKDIAGDRAVGSLTLPVLVGPRRTKQYVVIGCLLILPIVLWASLTVTARFVVLALYPVYLLVAIPFAIPERGPLYYGLVIDGEHLLVAAVAAMLWL